MVEGDDHDLKMLLLLLGVLVVLCALYLASCKPRGFPPGPTRLPLVGYLPFMGKEPPHKQWWKLSSTYGPVVGLYMGNTPLVVVNGWRAVKESLLNEDLNGRPDNIFAEILYDGKQRGVMFVENDFWKEQRRFTLHQFRNLGFGKRSHEEVIQDEARELLEEIEETKGSIRLQGLAGVSAINILWALVGGTRFSRKDPSLLYLVDILNVLFRAGEITGGIVKVFKGVRHVLPRSAGFNTVINNMKPILEFITKALQEHEATIDPANPRDFMDLYINEINKNKHNPDTTFTSFQLYALCTDLFSAGVETGSSSVAFSVLLSVLNPRVMYKVHKELDSVIGRSRLPCISDRTKLVYTEATLTEAFRFRGAAPLTVPHKALRDTMLQGHRIPAGATVMNNLYSIHMDKDYWGDPEIFRPERFINPDGSYRSDERMIPFGKGRRACLGESLARMTTYLLFTALMQRFLFTLDPALPVLDTEGKYGFTLGPPDFKVFAKARF